MINCMDTFGKYIQKTKKSETEILEKQIALCKEDTIPTEDIKHETDE